jgi:hypothetical protein
MVALRLLIGVGIVLAPSALPAQLPYGYRFEYRIYGNGCFPFAEVP